MPRCLILGGSGFIGSHLCEALLNNGHEVRVFDRSPPFSRVEWFKGDFSSDQHILLRAVRTSDVIYHLLSTTVPESSIDNPVYDIGSNIINTVKLLDMARQERVKKIIFISSGGTVYGSPRSLPIKETHPTNPICPYGVNKLAIEKYLGVYKRLYGLESCILRLSNPYGERQDPGGFQGVISKFLHCAIRGEPVRIMGDGHIIRDYFYVGDAVNAMVKVLSYQWEENIFNIGSGVGLSLIELLDIIEDIVGYPVARIYMKGRPFDVRENVLDVSRALGLLGWMPTTPIREGLEKTIGWFCKSIKKVA